MRSKWVINLCLFKLIISASTLSAQPQEAPELPQETVAVQAAIVENLPESKPADEAAEGGVKATLSKPESPEEPTPELNRSTRRGISSAIGSFIPTEEISADNAVPFPVDI